MVIALGREALAEALTLPPSIPVIYDMVVTPPAINRPNTVGFYMATPSSEYAELVRDASAGSETGGGDSQPRLPEYPGQ